MADLFLQVQMRRIERYFPLSHGIARVDETIESQARSCL